MDFWRGSRDPERQRQQDRMFFESANPDWAVKTSESTGKGTQTEPLAIESARTYTVKRNKPGARTKEVLRLFSDNPGLLSALDNTRLLSPKQAEILRVILIEKKRLKDCIEEFDLKSLANARDFYTRSLGKLTHYLELKIQAKNENELLALHLKRANWRLSSIDGASLEKRIGDLADFDRLLLETEYMYRKPLTSLFSQLPQKHQSLTPNSKNAIIRGRLYKVLSYLDGSSKEIKPFYETK